jgi:double-stranded uracil-DNA glycosylase
VGLTNAARRATCRSGDLRAADFAGARERLDEIAAALAPRALGFVGKAAYQGVFRERPEYGLQERRLGVTALFVLPSTSPANAAVRWSERVRWFVALRELVGADQPR